MSDTDNSYHIAFIDDDELDRMLLQRLVKKKLQNCIFHEASSPEQARELIKNNAIDLTFIDINLGHYDGFDVGQTLRDRSRQANLKIIFLSGHVRPQDQERAVNLTPYPVMQKPMAGRESEDFANTILTVLNSE